MWPFKCKKCDEILSLYNHSNRMYGMLLKEKGDLIKSLTVIEDHRQELLKQNEAIKIQDGIKWNSLSEFPPTNTNILVANKDFTYFGFLYYEDGWDYSRKINLHGKGQIWATYTNPESIHWWLNLDLIKKG